MAKMMSSFFILFILHLLLVCRAQTIQCNEVTVESGEILDSATSPDGTFSKQNKCWTLIIPADSCVNIYIETMTFSSLACSAAYIRITVSDTKEQQEFCSEDVQKKTITACSDVTVTYFHDSTEKGSSFALKYETETGVSTIKGLDIARKTAIDWLKKKQLPTYGWDKDTPRVIISLYLSGATSFNGGDLNEELMIKQLEVQTSIALLRNTADPLSVNEISMFINALRVACLDPRQFYGYDILKILNDRLVATRSNSPAAYLTLCSSNWTITETNVRSLMKTLQKTSPFPFYTDIQAMTMMALSCMKDKTDVFVKDKNAAKLLETTIKKFASSQLPDGSFGTIHTTALITQALLSNGQEKSTEWNVTSAVKYLMNQDSSTNDFISTSLVLPIFNGKSFASITDQHCKTQRNQGIDRKIFEILNRVGPKKQMEYALYVGDKKDIIHSISMRMPESNTVYDVMTVAAYNDQKYSFNYTDLSGLMYVYKIAGISNDPESGQFWHLFFGNSNNKGRITLRTESPDKMPIRGGDFIVMWYKTADI